MRKRSLSMTAFALIAMLGVGATQPCNAQTAAVQPAAPMSEAVGLFNRYDAGDEGWLAEMTAACQRLPNEARVTFADWAGNQVDAGEAASRILIELLRDPWRAARRHAAASLVRLGARALPAIARHWNPGPWTNEAERNQVLYLAWVLVNTEADPTDILFPGIFRGTDQPNAVIWDPYEINLSLYVFKQRGVRSAGALAPMISGTNAAVSARAIAIARDLGPAAAPTLSALFAVVEANAAGPLDSRIEDAMRLISELGEQGWARLLDWASDEVASPRRELANEVLSSTWAAREWFANIAVSDSPYRLRVAALRLLTEEVRATEEVVPQLNRLTVSGEGEIRRLAESALAQVRADQAVRAQGDRREPRNRRNIDPIQYGSRIVEMQRIAARSSETTQGILNEITLIKEEALNQPALVLALLQQYEIVQVRPLTTQICAVLDDQIASSPVLQDGMPALPWPNFVIAVSRCPLLLTPQVARAALARLARDGSGFSASTGSMQPDDGAAVRRDFLTNVREALAAGEQHDASSLAELAMLLGSSTTDLQKWAADVLSGFGPAASPALEPLRLAMSSENEEVSAAAANAILAFAEAGPDWETAARRVIEHDLGGDISYFFDLAKFYLYPPDIVFVGRPVSMLPPFPWPPPPHAAIALFGRDIPRSLIGGPEATLGSAYARLFRALRNIDPNFMSSLFGVPGGFALMTRTEQIDERGQPVPGLNRWRGFQQPPRSIRDYLVRLFLSPPGFYRTLVFVFTDDRHIRSGTGTLPDLEAGEQQLPPDIARIRLSERLVYILVYSFARRDLGNPYPYRLLSATTHLNQSGVLRELSGM
jgi:hypothetical protein